MLKTIRTYEFPTEAYIVKGRLEAEGIPTYIADDQYISANWLVSFAIGGVRVQVPSAYLEEAVTIIKELEGGTYEEELEAEQPETQTVHCPQCQSEDIRMVDWSWKLVFVLFLIMNFLPLPFSKYRMKCNNCSYKWVTTEYRSYSTLFLFLVVLMLFALTIAVLSGLYTWACKYILCY